MPSYPASGARAAHRTKSPIVDRPARPSVRQGTKGEIGVWTAWADEIAMVGVAPEVQDLQADPPTLGVDRVGDHAVLGTLPVCGERGSTLERTALVVGAILPVTMRPTPPRARSA